MNWKQAYFDLLTGLLDRTRINPVKCAYCVAVRDDRAMVKVIDDVNERQVLYYCPECYTTMFHTHAAPGTTIHVSKGETKIHIPECLKYKEEQ